MFAPPRRRARAAAPHKIRRQALPIPGSEVNSPRANLGHFTSFYSSIFIVLPPTGDLTSGPEYEAMHIMAARQVPAELPSRVSWASYAGSGEQQPSHGRDLDCEDFIGHDNKPGPHAVANGRFAVMEIVASVCDAIIRSTSEAAVRKLEYRLLQQVLRTPYGNQPRVPPSKFSAAAVCNWSPRIRPWWREFDKL